MLKKLMLVAVVATLVGCAHRPTAEEAAKADYGSYPNNYQEIVQDYMREALFDPYSAVYENWRGPSQGYVGGNFVETQFGYRVCVDLNVKNRMGGYVGTQKQYFMIKNGRVTFYTESRAADLCNF